MYNEIKNLNSFVVLPILRQPHPTKQLSREDTNLVPASPATRMQQRVFCMVNQLLFLLGKCPERKRVCGSPVFMCATFHYQPLQNTVRTYVTERSDPAWPWECKQGSLLTPGQDAF